LEVNDPVENKKESPKVEGDTFHAAKDIPDAPQSEPGRAVMTVVCEAIWTFAGRKIEQDPAATAGAAVVVSAANSAIVAAMALTGLIMVRFLQLGTACCRCPHMVNGT